MIGKALVANANFFLGEAESWEHAFFLRTLGIKELTENV
jgi:hypothetical protein